MVLLVNYLGKLVEMGLPSAATITFGNCCPSPIRSKHSQSVLRMKQKFIKCVSLYKKLVKSYFLVLHFICKTWN